MDFSKSTKVTQKLAVLMFKEPQWLRPTENRLKTGAVFLLVAVVYLLALLWASVCMRLSKLDHLFSNCYLPVCGKPVYVISPLPGWHNAWGCVFLKNGLQTRLKIVPQFLILIFCTRQTKATSMTVVTSVFLCSSRVICVLWRNARFRCFPSVSLSVFDGHSCSWAQGWAQGVGGMPEKQKACPCPWAPSS